MTARLFTSALFAGLAAGLIAVLLQYFLTEPLILEAEQYESGAKVHFAGVPAAQEAAPAPSSEMHMQEDPEDVSLFHRFGLAFAADFITFIAWGLIMVAGFGVAEHFGRHVSLNDALWWGVGGFVAVHLAPGVGLSPELPGILAAPLHARQIWWVMTVISAAGAMALIGYGRNVLAIGAALILLVVPHIIGAPELDEFTGKVPPELAGTYVAHAYAVAFAAWMTLSFVAGYFWNRNKAAVPSMNPA